MKYLIAFFMIVLASALEYFLGNLKHWAFGGIIPLLFIAYLGVGYLGHFVSFDKGSSICFIFIFLGLVAMWLGARESCKKKQKKELEKMKIQDLNK